MRQASAAVVVLLALWPRLAGAEEWFDAYGRGLDALKAGKADRAVESFARAIKLRAEPGTNLITYGTNRLDRYHPYLRLAEAYLQAGQPEKAKEALRRSAERGREPADERDRLAANVEAALEKARAAAAPPPPTTVAAAPPATTPPTTVAAMPAPPPTVLSIPRIIPSPSPTSALGVATGTLDLRSDPPGASVLVDDRLAGATPLKISLAPGDYTVTLRKEGSADVSFPVRIAAGRKTTETRTLVATAMSPSPVPATPAPATVASLVVTSEPPGAAVYLDDEPIGATDPGSGRLVKSGIAPGTHRLRLTHPKHPDFVQEITVTEGPTQVRAQMPVAPASALNPLVFAGIGILIVSLGAGILLWRRGRAEAEAPGHTAALPARATTPPAARPGATITSASRRTAVPPATQPEHDLEELVASEETSALPPSTRVSAANEFGEYRLLEQLGKGGMASVFKAERRGEICALKRPLSAFLEDPEFMERFLREAEIGRTLHHPNIIRIFERGKVKRMPYFTMELVKGETLSAHVRQKGPLEPKAATRIIVQVAEALDYAHLKHVIHRDLKPSNIMILEDGTVKVMDYGIARARRFEGLTVTGAFLGTPDYVAPETAEGKGTDARSDLYSLGIVFYEILTGKKPFVGDTPFATLRKHCTEPPTPPSVIAPGVPRELEAIILRLLAKDPADRHPDAEVLLIELRDFLNRAA